ncbi:MAG: hypothetical protein ACKO0V_01130, partial [bacterium]
GQYSEKSAIIPTRLMMIHASGSPQGGRSVFVDTEVHGCFIFVSRAIRRDSEELEKGGAGSRKHTERA